MGQACIPCTQKNSRWLLMITEREILIHQMDKLWLASYMNYPTEVMRQFVYLRLCMLDGHGNMITSLIRSSNLHLKVGYYYKIAAV